VKTHCWFPECARRVANNVAAWFALGAVLIGLLDSAAAQSAVRCWATYASDTDSRSGFVVDASAGVYATSVVLSDGRVFVNGANTYRLNSVPALPSGLRYDRVVVCDIAAGLVSDGTIRVWGTPPWGAPGPAPALPPGTSYDQVQVGYEHVMARRTDGAVFCWGSNASGQCQVPPLQPGTWVESIVAGGSFSLAILNSGQMIGWPVQCPGAADRGALCVCIRGA
jgi:Regulator of chromosome condensation (RCC1) repeat